MGKAFIAKWRPLIDTVLRDGQLVGQSTCGVSYYVLNGKLFSLCLADNIFQGLGDYLSYVGTCEKLLMSPGWAR